MTEQKTGLDLEVMRRGIEDRDAETLIGLYADDAEMKIVNRYTTPSAPRELHGKKEIAEHLRDVCGRAMTHRIEDEVVGEGRVAFNEACKQGPLRGDAGGARRQDNAPGQRRSLGRVARTS